MADFKDQIFEATEISSLDTGDYLPVFRQSGGQRVLRKVKKGVLVPPEAGLGDMTGPAGATDEHLVVFDGSTGKLTKDGGVIPAVPTKATGAEVDTGTDDAKFVTPKAIADSSLGGGASYLVYTALLSQTGTDAPVATVLENTLGETVVWARVSAGSYTATLSGAFTAGKTVFYPGKFFVISPPAADNIMGELGASGVNVCTLQTNVAGTGSGEDSWLTDTLVEIHVYP